MNQIKVFLIGLIAVWCIFGLANGKPQPENSGDCGENGYYNDPSDCTRYYQCYDGKRHDFQCKDKLYFDVAKERCEWPDTVECKN